MAYLRHGRVCLYVTCRDFSRCGGLCQDTVSEMITCMEQQCPTVLENEVLLCDSLSLLCLLLYCLDLQDVLL